MNEVTQDATQALADTTTEIEKLKGEAKADVKTVVVNLEAQAKTFYEKHVTAFAAVAGFAVGALSAVVKIKLL